MANEDDFKKDVRSLTDSEASITRPSWRFAWKQHRHSRWLSKPYILAFIASAVVIFATLAVVLRMTLAQRQEIIGLGKQAVSTNSTSTSSFDSTTMSISVALGNNSLHANASTFEPTTDPTSKEPVPTTMATIESELSRNGSVKTSNPPLTRSPQSIVLHFNKTKSATLAEASVTRNLSAFVIAIQQAQTSQMPIGSSSLMTTTQTPSFPGTLLTLRQSLPTGEIIGLCIRGGRLCVQSIDSNTIVEQL